MMCLFSCLGFQLPPLFDFFGVAPLLAAGYVKSGSYAMPLPLSGF
jgi:hypothetical protein